MLKARYKPCCLLLPQSHTCRWVWMIKNKLHSRAPYVIASLLSVALIGLYITSRTVNLPVVGIQEDVGAVDILCKVTQGGIVVVSLLLLRNWQKERLEIPQ